ncbi:hypothetical protein AB6A23_12535 [Paenibacillus tarimensis]
MQRKNNKFNEILKKKKRHKFHEQSELINIVWPSFVEIDGCVLIQNEENPIKKLNMDFILEQFGDRTGFEAAENHVHMIDVSKFFEKHPYEGLRFAMKLVNIWAVKLKLDFPDYKFVIILSFQDDDSIIRFHRMRENEQPWVEIDNLDGYKDEGILVEIV